MTNSHDIFTLLTLIQPFSDKSHMLIPTSGPTPDQKKTMPIAIGSLCDYRPMSGPELTALANTFATKSIGESYAGPSGICDDGVPWVILITKDELRPRRYREAGKATFFSWLWDGAPTLYFSLTLIGIKELTAPARWIGSANNDVVLHIKTNGFFRACISHTSGRNSGWFECHFANAENSYPSIEALNSLWDIPPRGLPHSRVGTRYRPFDKEIVESGKEITMWQEPISDYWMVLQIQGPWSNDLDEKDQKYIAWARNLHTQRSHAAGFVQVIKERQTIDKMPALLNEQGLFSNIDTTISSINRILSEAPLISRFLNAIAGAVPCAQTAYEVMVDILHDKSVVFIFFARVLPYLHQFQDADFSYAVEYTFKAALLDPKITGIGKKRPWLKNVGDSQLELNTITIDSSCKVADIEMLWRTGLELPDVLDAGEWFTPFDMPVPIDQVNTAFESVTLETTVECAKEQLIQLLYEAREARQWSIPWGARVQVQYGPFVALRIFEKNGEFSCHFLDQHERYMNIAIGFSQQIPKITSLDLYRYVGDEYLLNEEAILSIQLIAAAIVRDFLVVEERESVFSSRPLRKTVAGRKLNTIVYLPRVRYDQLNGREKYGDPDANLIRPKHSVTHHLRRVGKASNEQRFLAQKYGISLPSGFTFVRPHERGAELHNENIKIYRSRSASRMIFQEVAIAPNGSRPHWFDFEKQCITILKSEGMRVVHQAAQRDGDGGVDLFAVDQEGTSWVVQCKCWAPHRSVGPDVVRELIGAIYLADIGADSASKGMIITTSTLTAGARKDALNCGFRILEI